MPAQPTGSSGLTSSPIRAPISSTLSTPSAIAMRRCVPKRLMATGISPRVGRSNSSAGPLARTVRVTISLISSVGSTGAPHAVQLAGALERGEEVLEIGVREPRCRHAEQSYSRCRSEGAATGGGPPMIRNGCGYRWRDSSLLPGRPTPVPRTDLDHAD